jgi:phosphoribosylanthranilate isomerase
MLITKVKVSKITNLSEARYCAGMGVDFLSFPVSSVDPKTYQEITGWVSGPLFGIEINRENFEVIQDYKTDFVQVDFDCLDLLPKNLKSVIVIDANKWETSKSKLISSKERILFLELAISTTDSQTENLIQEIAKDFELFVKLTNTESLQSLSKLPAGISLEGGTEQRPGLKEYPLSEILEKLDADNAI